MFEVKADGREIVGKDIEFDPADQWIGLCPVEHGLHQGAADSAIAVIAGDIDAQADNVPERTSVRATARTMPHDFTICDGDENMPAIFGSGIQNTLAVFLDGARVFAGPVGDAVVRLIGDLPPVSIVARRVRRPSRADRDIVHIRRPLTNSIV